MYDRNDPLFALSPLDGRYNEKIAAVLAPYFSEYALIHHRLVVQSMHLLELVRRADIPTPCMSDTELKRFLAFDFPFTIYDARAIKAIEKKLNHDVKACEVHFGNVLESVGYDKLKPWLRFGMTSEDDNNLAYALMLRRAIDDVMLPALLKMVSIMTHWAVQYEALAMLSRTHGQPATPTTLGKEFGVFVKRFVRQVDKLETYRIQVKFGGASGNHAAAHVALPNVDWIKFAEEFCMELGSLVENRFEFNAVTTQIEPHDTYAELFDILKLINTITLTFAKNIWQYISDDWIVQKAVQGEVGSSAMPHKVNPIDFENAEGNQGISTALCEYFARKLPDSRLQRDLSDSTVERNFGVAYGHSLLAFQSVAKGMGKIAANEPKILRALEEHPEVITEAFQTILRREGVAEAYNTLKDISRGKQITLEDLQDWVHDLEEVSEEAKRDMLAITPLNYIGLAQKLARMTP